MLQIRTAEKNDYPAVRLAQEQQIQAIRLDVLSGNLPAEKVYTRLGFQYRGTIRMYYEDTGWTDYRIFELLLTSSGFHSSAYGDFYNELH